MRCSIRKVTLCCRNALASTKRGSFACTHSAAREPHEFGTLTFFDGKAYVGEKLVANTSLPKYLGDHEPLDTGIVSSDATLVVDPSNITYTGSHVQGMPQGEGKMTYPNGDKYEGAFVDGKRDGRGVSITNKGTYEGFWRAGKMHGQGRIVTPEGYVFEGEFAHDRILHGKGIMKTDHGSTFEGEWVNGKRSGPGKVTYANGEVLQGEFKNGKLYSGHGVTVHKGGEIAQGTWLHGKLHGQGKITYTDGQVLEGEFRSGRIVNGYGVVVHVSGNTELGHWVNGKLHGEGMFTYNNGYFLYGEFQEGKIYNGRGHYVYPNGAVLQAVWQNGVSVGDVVYTDIDGSEYTGGWLNNRKHGRGVVTYTDGRTLHGEFVQGRIHTGSGTVVFPTGAALTAEWRDGTVVSEVQYTFHYGATYVGGWAENSIHGFGTLITIEYTYVGHFEQGVKHGEGKLTYQDGRTLQGQWKDGLIYNGSGVLMRRSGAAEEEGTWVKGKFQSSSTATSNSSADSDVAPTTRPPAVATDSLAAVVSCTSSSSASTARNRKAPSFAAAARVRKAEQKTAESLSTASKATSVSKVTTPLVQPQQTQEQKTRPQTPPQTPPQRLTQQTHTQTQWPRVVEHQAGSEVYTGAMKNGLRHGHGTVTYSDGRTLQGYFLNNQIQFGSGHKRDRDGTQSVGTWNKGLLHGPGSIKYCDGRTLVGVFKDGRMHDGEGLLYMGQESTPAVECVWVNGCKHGPGKVYYENSVFEGHWVQDKRHGWCKQTYKDGKVLFEGEFRNDEMYHGKGKVIHAGFVYNGVWEYGVFNGTRTLLSV